MSKINYDQEYISNKVLEFIYDCALRDATLQQAFKGKKDWIKEIDEARQRMRVFTDRLLSGCFESENDYNGCFLSTVNTICEIINNNKPADAIDSFSFGNAQKLINMTAKYVYTLCYMKPEMRDRFRFCHCPMDSIMLDRVWRKYEEEFGTEKRKNDLEKSDDFHKGWGAEGLNDEYGQPKLNAFPHRYELYQNAVKNLIGDGDLYPIEYDYLVWEK